MTKTDSTFVECGGEASKASAASRLSLTITSSCESMLLILLDKTTFNRPGNGRNFSGMDSQVFRPMITAFFLEEEAVYDVIFLKNFMSVGNFHGSCPSFPIPMLRVAATTIWNPLRSSGVRLPSPPAVAVIGAIVEYLWENSDVSELLHQWFSCLQEIIVAKLDAGGE